MVLPTNYMVGDSSVGAIYNFTRLAVDFFSRSRLNSVLTLFCDVKSKSTKPYQVRFGAFQTLVTRQRARVAVENRLSLGSKLVAKRRGS